MSSIKTLKPYKVPNFLKYSPHPTLVSCFEPHVIRMLQMRYPLVECLHNPLECPYNPWLGEAL